MVSGMLLYQVNQRLNEIFGYSEQLPFAGLSVIVCGDFYQLPSVRSLPTYISSTRSIKILLILDLWRKFKMAELTEVMRKRENYEFINILNKIREGEIDEDVELTLKSRFFSKEEPLYPESAVHIFAENKSVEHHDEVQLDKLNGDLVSIQATDEIPKHIKLTESQVEAIKQRKFSETGNLAYLLKLKIGAQIMLTANAIIEDRLVNGLLGKVIQFKVVNEVTVIYVKFNDANAGLMTMQSDCLAHQQHWVPIRQHEASFGIKKNKSQPCIKRTRIIMGMYCS